MAYSWEDERIQNAGKAYQDAQKRGDQNGMNAAAEEAKRLRQDVYGYQVDQKNGAPTVTNGSKWTNSNPYKNYQQSRGLGASKANQNVYAQGQQKNSGGLNQVNSYSSSGNLYSQMDNAYSSMMENLRKQNQLAVDQGVSRLEANRGTLNQGYDEAARQAYVQKMQTQKGLPQALAGQGLTGGAVESSRLAVDTNYGNNVYANELARQNAMKELDQSISDLRTTGDLNLAEQQLALQQQGWSDYQNAYAQKIQQDNWLKEYEHGAAEKAKSEAIDLIPSHEEDYTAYINELLNDNDPSNDWLVPYVKMYRNRKIEEQNEAKAAAEQQERQDWLALQQLSYYPYY